MQLGALKDKFNNTHWTMHDSTNHLAAANAYSHLHPHTIINLPTNGHLPQHILQAGVDAIKDPWYQESKPKLEHCEWCHKMTHNTLKCHYIRQCLLCHLWGHNEIDCKIPHRCCKMGHICRVGNDHPNYHRTLCRTDVKTFRWG